MNNPTDDPDPNVRHDLGGWISGPMVSAGLTAADRALIERARKVAALRGPAIREHTRVSDPAMSLASAFGESQHLLLELATMAERLGGE